MLCACVPVTAHFASTSAPRLSSSTSLATNSTYYLCVRCENLPNSLPVITCTLGCRTLIARRQWPLWDQCLGWQDKAKITGHRGDYTIGQVQPGLFLRPSTKSCPHHSDLWTRLQNFVFCKQYPSCLTTYTVIKASHTLVPPCVVNVL